MNAAIEEEINKWLLGDIEIYRNAIDYLLEEYDFDAIISQSYNGKKEDVKIVANIDGKLIEKKIPEEYVHSVIKGRAIAHTVNPVLTFNVSNVSKFATKTIGPATFVVIGLALYENRKKIASTGEFSIYDISAKEISEFPDFNKYL